MGDRAVSVHLDVVARPGARRPAVTLRPDGTLVVSVTAPPEQGKANAALVRAIGELEGGAKLTLHYTDVTPGLIVAAVIRGGNHPFSRIVRADAMGQPEFALDAFGEVLRVYKDRLLSDVFIGWARGYLDSQRPAVERFGKEDGERLGVRLRWGHPREIMNQLADELKSEANEQWYDA